MGKTSRATLLNNHKYYDLVSVVHRTVYLSALVCLRLCNARSCTRTPIVCSDSLLARFVLCRQYHAFRFNTIEFYFTERITLNLDVAIPFSFALTVYQLISPVEPLTLSPNACYVFLVCNIYLHCTRAIILQHVYIIYVYLQVTFEICGKSRIPQ